ncbi:MAG: response regulator transcription factor [Kiritimatiellae bacterium]|nr:response regulator transcription factor [Kiritimatiellia bacterium]
MSAESIVIIEDDSAIRSILSITLKGAGYPIVKEAESGDEGLRLVKELKPSLVLLDLMLPGIDGFTVCKKIRESAETASTPVIMLTARSEEEDIVRGLECGADDYITKPFSRQVLLARIRAVLRRPQSRKDESSTEFDGLAISDDSHKVTLNGKTLDLTGSEYRVLSLLLSRPERVYTRSQIIDLTQDPDKVVTDRAVDVQIVGLRRKLGTWAKHIETIRGVGYRFQP